MFDQWIDKLVKELPSLVFAAGVVWLLFKLISQLLVLYSRALDERARDRELLTDLSETFKRLIYDIRLLLELSEILKKLICEVTPKTVEHPNSLMDHHGKKENP